MTQRAFITLVLDDGPDTTSNTFEMSIDLKGFDTPAYRKSMIGTATDQLRRTLLEQLTGETPKTPGTRGSGAGKAGG